MTGTLLTVSHDHNSSCSFSSISSVASPTSHTPASTAPKPSTPSAQPVVHYHHPPVKAFSPLPPFNPTNRTASTLVGAPPKLATQFIAPQVLELGAPRPRRWGRGKMEFRSITGGTIVLTSWQGGTSRSHSLSLSPSISS